MSDSKRVMTTEEKIDIAWRQLNRIVPDATMPQLYNMLEVLQVFAEAVANEKLEPTASDICHGVERSVYICQCKYTFVVHKVFESEEDADRCADEDGRLAVIKMGVL